MFPQIPYGFQTNIRLYRANSTIGISNISVVSFVGEVRYALSSMGLRDINSYTDLQLLRYADSLVELDDITTQTYLSSVKQAGSSLQINPIIANTLLFRLASLYSAVDLNPLSTTTVGGLPSTVDPFTSQVQLFLKGDGANNGTVITDSSQAGRTITRIGGVITSTDQVKYGASSLLFPTTGTNYLETITDSGLTFGSGDITFETWVRFTSINTTTAIMGNAQGYTSGDAGIFLCASPNEFRFRNWVFQNGAFFPTTIALNTWYHVAATKVGTTARIWVNGVEGTSGSLASTTVNPNPKFTLGFVINGDSFFSQFRGYMEGARVTKGVGRYTANFNPETDTYLN